MTITRNVFYSFHFNNDVFRVQQVRNMGVVEGDEPVSPNQWEEIKRTTNGIKTWIDNNLKRKSCLVVLIGTETARRKWVKYEIQRAWETGKGVLGINIHNLKCLKVGTCHKGENPFDQFTFTQDGRVYTPRTYDPPSWDAYNSIKQNLGKLVEEAIADRL